MFRNESASLRARITPLILALILVALLAMDPYSYGKIGGDLWLIPPYVWQIAITRAQVFLLATAVVISLAGRHRWALAAVVVETVLFLGANAVYLMRDGITRIVVGYSGMAWLGLLVVLGLAVRTILLRTLTRRALRAKPDAST